MYADFPEGRLSEEDNTCRIGRRTWHDEGLCSEVQLPCLGGCSLGRIFWVCVDSLNAECNTYQCKSPTAALSLADDATYVLCLPSKM